jgi:hypothetical protein
VNVLRHQHVSGNNELIPLTNFFELNFEGVVTLPPREERQAAKATERDEVKIASFLEPNQTRRH